MSKLTVTRKGQQPEPRRSIRREPLPPEKPMTLVGRLRPVSREQELRLVLIGVALFALAIFIITIQVSEITAH